MLQSNPLSAGEIRVLAEQLLSWANELALAPQVDRLLSEESLGESVVMQAMAGRIIARLRARMFPDTDFASSSWDVMLEIFIRETQGQRVSLDQLTANDCWPPLTVHRSINMLIDKQLVGRAYKDAGTREVWLSLTPAGKQKMAAFLLESARFSRPPPLESAILPVQANRTRA